jgi:flavorubredoxin/flavin reductase (DIM6/NTAB) family NADH-FMN oxidoreductase RutF
MYQYRNVTEGVYWVGGNDRRLALFENVHPIPRGMSYNAYFVDDEKTLLLDTVDAAVNVVLLENLGALLGDRPLDYVIVNHMEPDHAATLAELVRRWPSVTIVCNPRAQQMIRQFFDFNTDERVLVVKEGDTLSTGTRSYTFYMAPMVHWPETMVSYDSAGKILYTGDAFGSFGALGGSLFADELPFEAEWLPEARRYYANIVGKYGAQVQALLKKAAGLELRMICPLHGPVWRENIGWYIEKYRQWSAYEPEEQAVMIVYGSMYGGTMNAAEILAGALASRGVKNVVVYDVSVTHYSELVAEAFRCSHLIFASVTYNAGIFAAMETLLLDLKAHNFQNRKVAIIENGSWAPASGPLMRELIGSMKNMTILECTVSLRSTVKEEQRQRLLELADNVVASLPADLVAGKPIRIDKSINVSTGPIDTKAVLKLSYGLFVLTAREADRDNGCIINTAIQATSAPLRISITLNKANYTHGMIERTGLFNVSVLSTEAAFRVFQQFGFKSGGDTDKFADWEGTARSQNGLYYIPWYTNAFFSARVIDSVDCGTHTTFLADVTEAAVLSDAPSVTYDYYYKNIKLKPQKDGLKKKGFVCTVCGYVYEGDELPSDYICPVCKHGSEVFVPLS